MLEDTGASPRSDVDAPDRGWLLGLSWAGGGSPRHGVFQMGILAPRCGEMALGCTEPARLIGWMLLGPWPMTA